MATTNTGAVFSAIQEMNEPNTRAEVPPSVAPELLLPARPFSISSSHSTARRNGFGRLNDRTDVRLRLADQTAEDPASIQPEEGSSEHGRVALAVSDFPVPGMPVMSSPLGVGRP